MATLILYAWLLFLYQFQRSAEAKNGKASVVLTKDTCFRRRKRKRKAVDLELVGKRDVKIRAEDN